MIDFDSRSGVNPIAKLAREPAAERLDVPVEAGLRRGSRNGFQRNRFQQARASSRPGSRDFNRWQRLVFILFERREPPGAVIVGHADLLVHPWPVIGVKGWNGIIVAAVASAISEPIEPVDPTAALAAKQSAAAMTTAAAVATFIAAVDSTAPFAASVAMAGCRIRLVAPAGWSGCLASGSRFSRATIPRHHLGRRRQKARNHRRHHACPHRCSPH